MAEISKSKPFKARPVVQWTIILVVYGGVLISAYSGDRMNTFYLLLANIPLFFVGWGLSLLLAGGEMRVIARNMTEAEREESRKSATSYGFRVGLVAGLFGMMFALVKLFGDLPMLPLGAIQGNPDIAVPALIETLNSDDRETARYAIQSLGKYGVLARSAIPALKPYLLDSERRVWDSAVVALKSVDPDGAHVYLLPVLTEKLSNSDEREARLKCVLHLGRLGPFAKSALPLLRSLLEVEDKSVRRFATNAIKRISAEASR
jgi:HEAT repeat protein